MRMTGKPQKPLPGDTIKFWHPVRGGWYHATVLNVGHKWVRVRLVNGKRMRLPASAL